MLEDLLATLRGCRWIDLTHAFAPGIPHYAAFPDEEREELLGYASHGFVAHRYSHVGQWGTHVDPPSHFIEGGRPLDAIGVEEMVLPLRVVDLREAVAADPDHATSVADLEAHEAAHGRIPEGALVLSDFGWAARWPDPAAMRNDGHSPGWSTEAVEWLCTERAITAIGHDTTDTDPGQVLAGGAAPAETAILAAGRWQLELVAAMDEVPPAGALAIATWPKPAGGSGFPARVFAIAPSD
jgi:kynurenine formamidase